MWGLFQFDCGFAFLTSLVVDDAALKGRKSSSSCGQDTGGRHRTRGRGMGMMVICLLSAWPTVASRAAEPVYDIDIPAMNSAEALNRFAEQTGSVMLFSYDLARARQANAVRGRYQLLEGLELLLRDTGLSGGFSDKRVVIIAVNGNAPAGEGESVKKRSIFAGIAAALAGTFGANANGDQAEDTKPVLETVIVTGIRKSIEDSIKIKRDADSSAIRFPQKTSVNSPTVTWLNPCNALRVYRSLARVLTESLPMRASM